MTVDWGLAAGVTAAAVVGSLLGGRLAGRVREDVLRRAFGWFVAVTGVFVLAQQLPPDVRTNPLLWIALGLAVAVSAALTTRPGSESPAAVEDDVVAAPTGPQG